MWILRNSADAKGGTVKNYGLFHPIWPAEERKMAHDASETPVFGTNDASQERRLL
jgi:hypothetical protein